VNSYFFYHPFFYKAAIKSNSNNDLSGLTIRAAKNSELHAVAEVLTDSFHPANGLFFWMYPLVKLGIYEDLRTRINSGSPHYFCLVAIKSEKLVGTIEVSLKSVCPWSSFTNQYPYIANLAVSKSYRKQGIGKQLLLKCEQVAFEWGFSEIYLHVLEDNESAKKLYFAAGYRLRKVECNFTDWLFKRPKKLLLSKSFQ